MLFLYLCKKYLNCRNIISYTLIQCICSKHLTVMFWHREKKTPSPQCTADLGLSIINSGSCLGKNNPYLWILIRTLHLVLSFCSTAWDVPVPPLLGLAAAQMRGSPRGGQGRLADDDYSRLAEREGQLPLLLPALVLLPFPSHLAFRSPPRLSGSKGTPWGLPCLMGLHPQKAEKGWAWQRPPHAPGARAAPKVGVEHPRGQKHLFLIKPKKLNCK